MKFLERYLFMTIFYNCRNAKHCYKNYLITNFLTEEDACKRCCRPTQNSTCKPIEPTEILRDGTPCIHGYCESVSV